ETAQAKTATSIPPRRRAMKVLESGRCENPRLAAAPAIAPASLGCIQSPVGVWTGSPTVESQQRERRRDYSEKGSGTLDVCGPVSWILGAPCDCGPKTSSLSDSFGVY